MLATITLLPVSLPPLLTMAVWCLTFLSLLAVLLTVGRGLDKRVSLGMVVGITVLLNVALGASGESVTPCHACLSLTPSDWAYWWLGCWACG